MVKTPTESAQDILRRNNQKALDAVNALSPNSRASLRLLLVQLLPFAALINFGEIKRLMFLIFHFSMQCGLQIDGGDVLADLF